MVTSPRRGSQVGLLCSRCSAEKHPGLQRYTDQAYWVCKSPPFARSLRTMACCSAWMMMMIVMFLKTIPTHHRHEHLVSCAVLKCKERAKGTCESCCSSCAPNSTFKNPPSSALARTDRRKRTMFGNFKPKAHHITRQCVYRIWYLSESE